MPSFFIITGYFSNYSKKLKKFKISDIKSKKVFKCIIDKF